MCHLMFIPAGVPASYQLERAMENAGFSNPDGFGFALANEAGTEMFVFRSMDLFEVTAKFMEVRPEFMGDGLYHTRWGTHGETSIRNVHPFRVGTDRDTFLAHNGILPMVTWPGQGDWRSDTNNFCHKTLPSWGSKFDSDGFRKHVEDFIGGSKLVVITVNPAYEKNGYIFNESAGFWDPATSCWHSNSDHLPSRGYKTTKGNAIGYPRWWEMDDDDECGESCVSKAGKEAAAKLAKSTGIDPNFSSKQFHFPGQRMLTEADVLAAHGYLPTSMQNLDDVEVLEPCPTCGSFMYDSTWSVCSECRTCGECMMSVAEGQCTCYTPEWLRQRYEKPYNDDKPSVNELDYSRERPF